MIICCDTLKLGDKVIENRLKEVYNTYVAD